MERCQAITKSGSQCKNKAVENNYCRVHLKGSSSLETQASDVPVTPSDSKEYKAKPAPDVFGKLFGIFIGFPAGFFLVFFYVSQDRPFIAMVCFMVSLITSSILGRGVDHMMFINNRKAGETMSELIPAAFAIAVAIGAAVIAFSILGGLGGVIAAIVAAVVAFIWAFK